MPQRTDDPTNQAPDYVHRLLDAYLSGDLLDVGGLQVPDDVQARLERTFGRRQPQGDTRALELPAKGYVRPGDPPVYCDACDNLCHYWELHHLDPIGWGGNDSRLLTDRQVIWVRLDGSCHSTAHMILDTFKPRGIWDDLWLNGYATPIPHAIVEVARRGWNLNQKRLQQPTTENT